VHRRSRKSSRTDAGMHAPSFSLSKRMAKQPCQAGAVLFACTDLEPRVGALTAEIGNDYREFSGETRRFIEKWWESALFRSWWRPGSESQ
jgi:hypothetical protein